MELPEPGDVFDGRYRLERVLGEGGFARVFLAVDIRGDRSVALKVLAPEGERYEAVTKARFEREVQLVARLRDPHTVRMFDYGTSSSGLLYLVFELVPGRDLSEILREVDTLPEDTIVHVLRQVLASLREAHAVGLLHRDIKPKNIRVFEYMGDPWSVKLLDFGIAKETVGGSRAKITQTGGIVGTPRYMSPEQLLFEELTPSSDIFSLGVTAYEMLMGGASMHGTRVGDQLERLGRSDALVVPGSQSARFRGVLQRMLAREASDRFQSADDVLAALGQPSHHSPIAPAPSYQQTVPRRAIGPPASTAQHPAAHAAGAPSNKLIALVAGVLALVLVVAAVVVQRTDPPRPPTATKRKLPLQAMTPPQPRRVEKPIDDAAAAVADLAAPDVSTADVAVRLAKGCGRDPQWRTRKKLHDERGREMNVYVPTRYDINEARPLVILLHDAWETANGFWWDSGFQDVAEKRNVLVVSARDNGVFGGNWSDDSDAWIAHDVIEFTDNFLCIDHRQIFIYGMGHGAKNALRAACLTPSIAAIATSAHRMGAFPECDRAGPIPSIHFVGRKNRHFPIDGGANCEGESVPSLERQEDLWRERNRCSGESRIYREHKKSVCRAWDCEGPLVSCELDGGRGPAKRRDPRQTDFRNCDGKPPKSFPMAETIWRFFDEVGAR